ncbi:unnamed protein product [Urochloa humidicola]
MTFGDPNTRPEEETVYVPNTFDLERDAHDWEDCTLVPWAMHLPRGAGARDIEDLLLDKLRLERGDITVTVNQPEPFLVRFKHGVDCAEARRRGRFTDHGIDIYLRPWRSLTHALGMCIFFRVRMYLDGIPEHAWTLEIVERVIGSKCALQCINTDLVQPEDTRHFDLYAWSVNPSEIPRRVWLTFTHRPSDKCASSVLVSEAPPDRWQQGVRYEVFLHIGLVEDYTAASSDLQGAVSNPQAFTPVRRPYKWRYGLMDGAPANSRSTYPMQLPLPPRDPPAPTLDDDRHGERARREHDARRPNTSRRDARANERCKDDGFYWPTRRDDEDDDDDYPHPGRAREREPVQRERTRSPRRCDVEFRSGRRRARMENEEVVEVEAAGTQPAQRANLDAFAATLPRMQDLSSRSPMELQALFSVQAHTLKQGFLHNAFNSQLRALSASGRLHP